MQNNDNNQQLQQYKDRIRTEIQNAGDYQINYINTINDINMITMELSNAIGRNIYVSFYPNNNNNKWRLDTSTGKVHEFNNFELAFDYFSEHIRSNAVKNFIPVSNYYDDIEAVINNVGGYTIDAMFCDLDKNDFYNTIKISLRNQAGGLMNVRFKIQNDGRCYFENQTLDKNGRVFDNVDSALQSLKDKLSSNQWRNVISHAQIYALPASYNAQSFSLPN